MVSATDLTRLSKEAAAQKGLQPGIQFYSPFPFAGINTQASGIAMDDREFRYIENFFRIGDGKLRAAWDVGTALYTAPAGRKIVYFKAYNIGVTYYFFIVLDNGTGYQVNFLTGQVTNISLTPNTFYNAATGTLPVATLWGTQYLLISNRNTVNDFWAWDGNLLYTAGGAAPNGAQILTGGQNYSSLPTVTAFGGLGSGVQIMPVINGGAIVELLIANPGTRYQVGDTVQLAFSGGGSDASAILQANLSAGSVTAVNITAPGSLYTTATVTFSSPTGSTATATATVDSFGIIRTVTVTNPGSGYTSSPTVSVTGGSGTGAVLTAVVQNGQVVSVTINNGGAGYVSPSVTIAAPTGATAATGTVTITGGQVSDITITNGGAGYTTAPTVTITGDGTGAQGVAVISASSLSGVTVVRGGSGFLFAPNITFVGGGGHAASGIVNLVGTSIAKIDVINGGANYNAVPTVALVGGFQPGSGGVNAKATAVLSGGQVVAINITNAGSGYVTNPQVVITAAHNDPGAGATAIAIFNPTSIASVTMSNFGLNYTSAPAVVIQPGANNAAYANLTLMPFGVSGDCLETFQSRAFVGDPAQGQFSILPPGGQWQMSAASTFWDYATSDGGIQFTSTDAFLQTQYIFFKQSNGYLYFFGDGSTSVLSNLATSGVPATTTFNYQNVDPQIGCRYRGTVEDYSRTIIFMNQNAVYGLYGGAVSKVSDKIDDFFVTGIFPPDPRAITPTAATATIFDRKHYILNMTITDPKTNLARTVLLAWNEREWVTCSQSINFTYIDTQKVASNLNAWGTDGNALYPLFQTPSSTLLKRLDTKLYGANSPFMIKDVVGFWAQARDLSSGASGISLSVTADTGGLSFQSPTYPSVPTKQYPAPLLALPAWAQGANTLYYPVVGAGDTGVPFVTCGLEITSTSPDFIFANLLIGYLQTTAVA